MLRSICEPVSSTKVDGGTRFGATAHTYNLSTGYLGKSIGGILEYCLSVCLQCQVLGHQGLHSEMLCPQT